MMVEDSPAPTRLSELLAVFAIASDPVFDPLLLAVRASVPAGKSSVMSVPSATSGLAAAMAVRRFHAPLADV